ncbi:MAG TPA: hypothetical protein VFV37_03960, partial [Luteibaculaceae bacterium]|nr:hypothetical protein [Luteibaculaceae bacterium]
MCYQVAIQTKKLKHVAHIKGQSVVIDMDEPVIKAFNHPALPVIVSHTETPVHHMNWGLIPPWA